MQDRFETMKMRPLPEGRETAADILAQVYSALQRKGYDPIDDRRSYIYHQL